jgi:hypothetical protein
LVLVLVWVGALVQHLVRAQALVVVAVVEEEEEEEEEEVLVEEEEGVSAAVIAWVRQPRVVARSHLRGTIAAVRCQSQPLEEPLTLTAVVPLVVVVVAAAAAAASPRAGPPSSASVPSRRARSEAVSRPLPSLPRMQLRRRDQQQLRRCSHRPA